MKPCDLPRRDFGENLEVEYKHALWGREGSVRLTPFLNYARMGGFRDALAFAAANGGTPAVGDVRRDREKMGFGIGRPCPGTSSRFALLGEMALTSAMHLVMALPRSNNRDE